MGPANRVINRRHVTGLVAVLLTVGGLVLATRPSGPTPVRVDPTADARVGTEAPDVDLIGLDGSHSTLGASRGQVVALDFWATYCNPCIRSMPHLQELESELPADRFELISINVDPPSSERTHVVTTFLGRLGLTHRVYLDNGRASFLYQATRIPLLLVIDEAGVIRYVFRGFVEPSTIDEAVRFLVDDGAGPRHAP